MNKHLMEAGLMVSAFLASPVAGQCPTVDFDDLAVGTAVTTQYDGVTFSTRYANGSAGPAPVIYDPAGGTTSEPRCLSARGDSSGDFSEEYLRMVFDEEQTAVTFMLGVRAGCEADDTVRIRWYDGATLVGTRDVPVNGVIADRVALFVQIERPSGLNRIEIEGGAAGGCAARFELVDDLRFELDDSAPVADITIPPAAACVCSGDTFSGSAYDADGTIKNWVYERKAPDTASWTLVHMDTDEILAGPLTVWNPSPSAAQGYYLHRLRVTNECGIESSDTTMYWLDREFDTVHLRSPPNNAILGGVVCIDGTVWDWCAGELAVEYRPPGILAYHPVDWVADGWVATDTLGQWNTRAELIADGDYYLRIRGTDGCENTAEQEVKVTVDNNPPQTAITAPPPCACVSGVVEIRGTVSDPHFDEWTLWYAGGTVAEWQLIDASHVPIVNGLIATWDTRDLEPCSYTLRLVGQDRSIISCDDPQQAEYLVSVEVGDCTQDYDFDADDDGDVDLFDYAEFGICYTGPDPK